MSAWEIISGLQKEEETAAELTFGYVDTEQAAWFSESQEKSLPQPPDLRLLASRTEK